MQDELGLNYTAASSLSPALFNDALEKYLASDATTMSALDAVLEQDPDMPMALLFRAYLLKLAADPRFKAPITSCYDALASHANLNEREKHHLVALDYWHKDQLNDAVRTFDDIVQQYPKDMLALRVAHYLHFYGDGGERMLASLSGTMDQWSEADRYFGYLKGMHCFALEESGRYIDAEQAGIRALEINSSDVWAAHAVTHILQMQGRYDEGVPFIELLRDNWSHVNNFVNHMHWHQALLHMGEGEQDKALAIYDDKLISPLKDDFYLDVCNAASLLWRLTMLGTDVGERWQDLLALSCNRVEDNELVFSTLHYLMAPVVLNDQGAVGRGLANIDTWAQSGNTQGDVCQQVGVQLAKAISLLGTDQKTEGASMMAGIQDKICRIGGSHAQRHLFDQLIEYYG